MSVTAGGEYFDGISVAGNVRISDNADVEIKADKGVGIASDESVEIDGAKLDSKALNAGIDACGLSVTNNSDVVLQATGESCNAAFIRKVSGETGGIIIISGSKLKAESSFPGLFSTGHMTIDGGEVKAVSTEDSAIWAVGNLTVKGGAKLKLDGAYPSGCPDGSLFTVEAADIDAKTAIRRIYLRFLTTLKFQGAISSALRKQLIQKVRKSISFQAVHNTLTCIKTCIL